MKRNLDTVEDVLEIASHCGPWYLMSGMVRNEDDHCPVSATIKFLIGGEVEICEYVGPNARVVIPNEKLRIEIARAADNRENSKYREQVLSLITNLQACDFDY